MLADTLGDDLSVGIFVDDVFSDWDLTLPVDDFSTVGPHTTLTNHGDLFGFVDLDWVG